MMLFYDVLHFISNLVYNNYAVQAEMDHLKSLQQQASALSTAKPPNMKHDKQLSQSKKSNKKLDKFIVKSSHNAGLKL